MTEPARSPLPHSVEVQAAQRALLNHCTPRRGERIGLLQARGRVANTDHLAQWPLPQWRLSKMDGYAVADTQRVTFLCVGESAAGAPASQTLTKGQCLRVSTGAVLPEGCVAVVPQEDITRDDDVITLTDVGHTQIAPGRYIREIGSDLVAKARVAQAGQTLDEGRLSLLAATGFDMVEVFAPPRVGILSTGSELVPLGQTPQRGQIVATNAMVLRWQCEKTGAHVVAERQVKDSRPQTQEALSELAEQCDLVLTCGGISVGPHDHILPSLEALNWQGLFRKVKLAPGRPTTAGRLNQSLILALPGNPASSYVTFELFVRPVLRHLLGYPEQQIFRPLRTVSCDNASSGDGKRERYLRVTVQGDRAFALSTQQSGDLSSLCGHNALLRIPAGVSQGPYQALLLCEHDFEAPSPRP